MAKRRDMMVLEAQRRKAGVPIRKAKAVRTMTVRFIEVQDVYNKKGDGTQGAVKKVTSALLTEVAMKGLPDPINCRVAVDVDTKFSPTDELEKSFKAAFNETINFIVTEYCQRVAKKEADRKAELGDEPEGVFPAIAKEDGVATAFTVPAKADKEEVVKNAS